MGNKGLFVAGFVVCFCSSVIWYNVNHGGHVTFPEWILGCGAICGFFTMVLAVIGYLEDREYYGK